MNEPTAVNANRSRTDSESFPQTDASRDAKPQRIKLTVVRVENGDNTAKGQYFYNFEPHIVLCYGPTDLYYELDPASSPGLWIRAVVSSAPPDRFEVKPILPMATAAHVANPCLKPELVNVAILVGTSAAPFAEHPPIVCDPQVLNVPD